MTMTPNGKIPRPTARHRAYRTAFDQLDAALAKNSRSNVIERIDMARIALFGCLPETQEPAKTAAAE